MRADDLQAELEQVDFFMQQSLHDEARSVLDELDERFPREQLLADKRAALDAAAASQVEEDEGRGAIPGGGGGGDAPRGPVAKLSQSERADPGTHGDLGIAYKQMGLYDAAIAEFKQLTDDGPRAVFALTMIGECIEAKGELGEAVGRYKEALNLPQITTPESLELYYLLGLGVRTPGRPSRGAVFLREPAQARRQLPRRRAADHHAQATSERAAGVTMRRSTSIDDRAATFFMELQDRITTAIAAVDGRAQFREDSWTRPTGGGGRTRVLADGAVFEKAGVGFSDVYGALRPEMARALPGTGDTFRATGISLIFHPKSPRIPTVHANVRHIQRGDRGWFGGGTDLTPYYVVAEDASAFSPDAARLLRPPRPVVLRALQALV